MAIHPRAEEINKLERDLVFVHSDMERMMGKPAVDEATAQAAFQLHREYNRTPWPKFFMKEEDLQVVPQFHDLLARMRTVLDAARKQAAAAKAATIKVEEAPTGAWVCEHYACAIDDTQPGQLGLCDYCSTQLEAGAQVVKQPHAAGAGQ